MCIKFRIAYNDLSRSRQWVCWHFSGNAVGFHQNAADVCALGNRELEQHQSIIGDGPAMADVALDSQIACTPRSSVPLLQKTETSSAVFSQLNETADDVITRRSRVSASRSISVSRLWSLCSLAPGGDVNDAWKKPDRPFLICCREQKFNMRISAALRRPPGARRSGWPRAEFYPIQAALFASAIRECWPRWGRLPSRK